MAEFYIYSLEDPRTGKPFYIGKGKDNRALSHLFPYEKKAHPYVFNVIQQLKREGLEPDVFILRDSLTEAKALAYEQIMIAIYGRRINKTGILCNLTDGGEGISGYRHTVECKQQLSILSKGRPAWNKGISPSDDICNQISATLKGRHPTNGVRRNQSEAQKCVYEITWPEGQYKEIIHDLKLFCLDHNLSYDGMIAVAKGRQIQCKGFKCRKLEVSKCH
jgi:hypothetical protein